MSVLCSHQGHRSKRGAAFPFALLQASQQQTAKGQKSWHYWGPRLAYSLASHRNELIADCLCCPVTPYHTSLNTPPTCLPKSPISSSSSRSAAARTLPVRFPLYRPAQKKNAKTNIGCYPKQLPVSRRPPPSRSSSRSAARSTSTPSSSRTRTRPRS